VHNRGFHQGYVLAAILGAAAGGLVVACASKAFPRMMAHMMSQMMQDRMAHMGESGCDPADT
jgi:hypothetical protein